MLSEAWNVLSIESTESAKLKIFAQIIMEVLFPGRSKYNFSLFYTRLSLKCLKPLVKPQHVHVMPKPTENAVIETVFSYMLQTF